MLLSQPLDTEAEHEAQRNSQVRLAVLLALVTGVMFAGQSLALREAGDASEQLVLVGARGAVVVLVSGALLVWRRPSLAVSVRDAGNAALGGVLLLAGDFAYLGALARGSLAVAAILSQLNPGVSIVLAAAWAHEFVHRRHIIGGLLAVVGATLLAAG